MGSWSRLKHEKRSSLEKCYEIQAHFHKFGKIIQKVNFNTQMDFHFGSSCNFVNVSKNLKHKQRCETLLKLNFLYTIENALKQKYLKWACVINLEFWNSNYDNWIFKN